jgi:hypothetical protein
MKISKLITLLFLVAFAGFFSAQQLETKWTEKIQYDNKIDGFFDNYIGNNSQYLYAKFSNLALSPKKRNKKIKIIALNKTTLGKEGELKIAGYPQNKATEDLDFYRIISLDNIVYVVWTKEEKKEIEVYLESYDPKLAKVSKLKKVYSLKKDGKASDKLVLLYNNEAGNIILIGKELGIEEKEAGLKFEYNIITSDLDVKYHGLVDLPILVKRSNVSSSPLGGKSVGYELADNSKIYVYDELKRDKKEVKKGEASVFPIVVQITPSTGKSKSFNVRFENKNTFKFSTLVTKQGVSLCGFFCDLDKDPKGDDTHGIFYLTMDENEFKPASTRFTYFDRQFLDKLYEQDKEDQRKSGKFNKSKKKSDEESIDGRYVIESIQQEGKDLILFCSIMYNWERTVCTSGANGVQTCRTYYYCNKKNVTAFRLSAEGGLVWASNLDRFFQYPYHDAYDVSVMKKDGSYFVLYNSAYQLNSTKKNRKSKKSGEQLMDRFEYATFNATTGEYKKFEAQVNAVNTPRKEKKYVNAAKIAVLDNQFYTYSERVRLKPKTYFSLLFPPLFYILYSSGNSREGEGYLGSINVKR